MGLGLYATDQLPRRMGARWLGRRLGSLVLPAGTTVRAAALPLDLALTAAAARCEADARVVCAGAALLCAHNQTACRPAQTACTRSVVDPPVFSTSADIHNLK